MSDNQPTESPPALCHVPLLPSLLRSRGLPLPLPPRPDTDPTATAGGSVQKHTHCGQQRRCGAAAGKEHLHKEKLMFQLVKGGPDIHNSS